MRGSLSLTLLLVTVSAPALADSDGAIAESLFREGRRAASAGNYALACPKFEESYKHEPARGTLLSLADCEENLGLASSARHRFQQLYDELPPSDDRRALVEARLRALELRAPKLRIVLGGNAQATVSRDDVTISRASLGTSAPVDPGRHHVVVTSPGHRDQRYEVSIAEGEEKELDVTPGEALEDSSTSPPVRTTSAAPTELTPPRHNPHVAAYALGSSALATLALGATFGGVALSQLAASNGACTHDVCANQEAVNQFHTAQSFAIAADVTIGISLALLATATILFFIKPHRTHIAIGPLWIGAGVGATD